MDSPLPVEAATPPPGPAVATPVAATAARTGASTPAPAAGWITTPVIAAALAVFGILAVHAQTAGSIVQIWIRSETFTHGFVILPMCAWLIWRKRAELRAIPAAPWWPGLLGVLAAGAMWFVTSIADVLGLKQFALAFMVQGAFVTVVGLRVSRTLAFPLAFFLFAIPVGEIFVPTLIEWTANFTVAALRLSGVPVYREANQFVIPTGTWSVVEACSGIRYIIASVMIGTIYAALVYHSARRRLLFVAAAVVTPIVANWLRAYMIVMLGHLSNNRVAVGVDHIIYGWFFFGIVMMLMFWIGSRWQEDAPVRPAAASSSPAAVVGRPAARPTALFAAAVACIVAAGIWLPIEARIAAAEVKSTVSVARWPSQDGWEQSSRAIADWAPRYRGFVWDTQQDYRKDGRDVGVYVAFYRNQSKGQELVTSSNELTILERDTWMTLSAAATPFAWNGKDVEAELTRIRSAAAALDVVRLYWVDGAVTASPYVAKAWLAWSRLRGRGDDAALIVLYTPHASDGTGAAAMRSFAQAMSPAIDRALDDARKRP